VNDSVAVGKIYNRTTAVIELHILTIQVDSKLTALIITLLAAGGQRGSQQSPRGGDVAPQAPLRAATG